MKAASTFLDHSLIKKWKAKFQQRQAGVFLGKVLRLTEYYYPLSFLGTLAFTLAFYLAGYAYGFSNLYALLIALPTLFFIIIQIAFIRLWALRQREIEIIWDSNHSLQARQAHVRESELRLKLSASSVPYFFRYHLLLHATLKAGKEANFYYFQEASSSAAGEIRVGMYFPLCGLLSIKARLLVRDILGLSRTRLGPVQYRSFKVRPPLLTDRSSLPRHSASSLESRQNQRQADEDKYYMREYIPGDRLKDINWKSSLRVGELITRISPQSPEQSPLLSIELRNLSYADRDSPLSLSCLNMLKSWLLSFLLHMRQENPKYRFLVASAEREDMLSTDKDIEDFALLLAELTYAQKSHWISRGPAVLEKFIFTSCFDPSLGKLSQEQSKCHVFQLVPGKRSKSTLFRLLPLEHSVPWPGKWIFRSGPKQRAKISSRKGTGLQRQIQVYARVF